MPRSTRTRLATCSILVAAAAIAAACGRSNPQSSDLGRDLTLASHGSVSPNLMIAPDEISPSRGGRTHSTVRQRVLIHRFGGPDLAPAATGTPAPVAPTLAVSPVVAAPAPAVEADPNSPHIAMVASVAGEDAPRPQPTPEVPAGGLGDYGPYGGAEGGGGVIIRGGHAGEDHCERRPGIGILGGGAGGVGRIGPPTM
jgi:hypothetical protein